MDFELASHQQTLERLYSKNQLIPRIREEILNSRKDWEEYFDAVDIPMNFGIMFLVQLVIHKRADVPTMFGLMRNQAQKDLQLTAQYLEKCLVVGLADWDYENRMFVIAGDLTPEVHRELEMFQYPLPMVVPPRIVRNNRTSGYLMSNCSIILKDNHHDGDVVLDHINRMNQIPLRINLEVVENISNTWRGLDKKKEDESWPDFQKRKRAFEKYDRTAKDVIEILLEKSDKVFITWAYDKRGRCYSRGYHVNPHGNEWNKAVVEFAEGEIVTN